MFYVGQHNNNNSNYLGSGKALKEAIKKYGRKNFTREILEVCSSAEVDKREEYWIRKTGAFESGYNRTRYAKGGHPATMEIRKKMSDAHIGKHHSEETRKKMSEWRPSAETLKKMSVARIGEKNPMYGKHPIPWNKGKTNCF